MLSSVMYIHGLSVADEAVSLSSISGIS